MTGTTPVAAWYQSLYQCYEIRGIVTITLRARVIYEWYRIGTTILYEDNLPSHFAILEMNQAMNNDVVWLQLRFLFLVWDLLHYLVVLI